MGNKKNYGLPYMGSKSKIVDFIARNIPSCEVFVDLFCGGGSVTHYMIENGRYSRYICNDKNTLVVDLLKNVLKGKYSNECEFITREEFLKRKNEDGYIRYVWSFGNRGTSYLYSGKMEDYKRCLHNAIFNDSFSELLDKYSIDLSELSSLNKDDIRARVNMTRKIMKRMSEENFEGIGLTDEMMEYIGNSRLQHIENINRLNEVQFDNEMIEFSSLSYQNVMIPDNSVIYCDIPYKGTGTYTSGKFDYDEFYRYAMNSEHPIFISEYDMPTDFICVDEIDKKCQFKNSVGAIDTVERIYTTPKSLDIIFSNPDKFRCE